MDVEQIRREFPILARRVNGKPLVYLDSAATTQKPRPVLEAMRRYYEERNANVHRAIHTLGEEATAAYEEARATVARFIGATDPSCCVFVRNTTEAINLVAYAWGLTHLGRGDEVVLTPMEHHSNLVPWQMVAERTGARLRFIPLNPDGTLQLEALEGILSERTRMVALVHVSNVLGTVNPVAEVARRAHAAGALVLVDAAQSVPHMRVDVTDLDCDFLAFSGHKMCGPMGIGVLYGRRELLDAMPPFLGGGEMIRRVTLETSTFKEAPLRFEAGTPNVAGAVGLAAAVAYLEAIGMADVREHERRLTQYALERLAALPGVTVYGPRGERGGVVAFNVEGVHPHDVAAYLDGEGVAVRAGHHCAQPLMDWLGVAATVRASFYLYNTEAEVDALVTAVEGAREFFGHVVR